MSMEKIEGPVYCRVCGRLLKSEQSKRRRIGPGCWAKLPRSPRILERIRARKKAALEAEKKQRTFLSVEGFVDELPQR
jgi:hypothetical protein